MPTSSPLPKRSSASGSRKTIPTGLLVVVGLLVMGGSYALAADSITGGAQSLLSAAVSAAAGTGPSMTIARDSSSPSGNISYGYGYTLGVFNLLSRNIKDQSFVYGFVNVNETGTGALIRVVNPQLAYQYCVPTSQFRGYGYSGVTCDSVNYGATNSVSTGSTANQLSYRVKLPVYADQIRGTIYFYGSLVDFYGSASTAKVQVSIASASGAGPTCSTTDCSYGSVPVDTSNANGNILTIVNKPVAKTAVLTGAKNASFGNQTITAGKNSAHVASFTITAANENVNLNRIVISTTNASALSNLQLINPSTGTQVGSLATASTTNTFFVNFQVPNQFTQTFDLYANVAGSATGSILTTLSAQTGGVGASSGKAVTIGSNVLLQADKILVPATTNQ